MTYVMSDIHGNYEKYKEALQLISFKDTDTLYVVGDVIDRGADSMKLLLDMMCRINVLPLVGNHEFMAVDLLEVLHTLDDPSKLPEAVRSDFQIWRHNGGESTMKDFLCLDKDDQEAVVEYLGEFEFYYEITVNGQDYVLSHAGINNFQEGKDMEDYSPFELVSKRMDYSKPCFADKFLISGHEPTRNIHGKDEIYRAHNHIAIDCGAGWGGPLAVLCLETGKEFYARGH